MFSAFGSWYVLMSKYRTLSPLRLKRMQESAYEQPTGEQAMLAATKRKNETESEADRALTVVAKKLSKTLSVSATVNELIQQARDVRNLAVLYAGRSLIGLKA